jgi:hypothetical protein
VPSPIGAGRRGVRCPIAAGQRSCQDRASGSIASRASAAASRVASWPCAGWSQISSAKRRVSASTSVSVSPHGCGWLCRPSLGRATGATSPCRSGPSAHAGAPPVRGRRANPHARRSARSRRRCGCCAGRPGTRSVPASPCWTPDLPPGRGRAGTSPSRGPCHRQRRRPRTSRPTSAAPNRRSRAGRSFRVAYGGPWWLPPPAAS